MRAYTIEVDRGPGTDSHQGACIVLSISDMQSGLYLPFASANLHMTVRGTGYKLN
jgi:hypothetical protein